MALYFETKEGGILLNQPCHIFIDVIECEDLRYMLMAGLDDALNILLG